eukprot:2880475-Pleurochrysis_carterae.AAC.2
MGCGASKVPPTVDEPCVASDTSHHNPSSQHKKTKSERTATSKKYLAPEDEEERDFIAEASKEPQSRTQPDVCTQIPLPPAQKPVIQQSAVASGAGNVQQVANKENTSPARQQSQPAEVMVIPQPPVGSPPPMDIALKREAAGKPVLAEVAFTDHLGAYGSFRFRGAEAANYLQRHGLQPDALDDYSWTRTSADKVAAAVLEWARSKGATLSTHWFQPLGSAGIRRGQTGQVHNAVFNFGKGGELEWCFEAGDLLKGETDGSSYMNGGMRATHTAGGYTVLDPSSPMWVRGDTLFIPTLFVSYTGKALDEKTPLLRAMQAVSTAGVRLLKALGHTCKSVFPNIGLEQEFFLVPKKAFRTRTDLQLAGRTVMGRAAPRGQELSDHYMSPLNAAALRCMKEMQHECFKMGIPLKTRHREVAPNQYECAPFFGLATVQIDENLLVMELMEEIADKHNLVCLLAEKPFKGINGSGKHNNFSLGTEDGLNLFNGPQMTKVTGNDQAFPVVMAAVIKAVHAHGDLMRMSIASPGNDFRLGAMEAPPAIMSTYLGKSLTSYLEAFKRGEAVGAYVEKKSFVHMGLDSIAPFAVPAEDRNRTSPFPYGGHRFEFRAVRAPHRGTCAAYRDSSRRRPFRHTMLAVLLRRLTHQILVTCSQGARDCMCRGMQGHARKHAHACSMSARARTCASREKAEATSDVRACEERGIRTKQSGVSMCERRECMEGVERDSRSAEGGQEDKALVLAG